MIFRIVQNVFYIIYYPNFTFRVSKVNLIKPLDRASLNCLTLLDLFSLSRTAENDVLCLVSVEPTHRAVVHLQVELSALVTDTNGVENGSATFDILQVDVSSYSHAFPGFSLEGVTVEEDITTVGISSISTFVTRIRKVHNDSTILHDTIVGIARGVFHDGSFSSIELYVRHKAFCCWKTKLFESHLITHSRKFISVVMLFVVTFSQYALSTGPKLPKNGINLFLWILHADLNNFTLQVK